MINIKYKWDTKILNKKPIQIKKGQFRRFGKNNKIVRITAIDGIEPNFIEINYSRWVNKRTINPYKIVK